MVLVQSAQTTERLKDEEGVGGICRLRVHAGTSIRWCG